MEDLQDYTKTETTIVQNTQIKFTKSSVKERIQNVITYNTRIPNDSEKQIHKVSRICNFPMSRKRQSSFGTNKRKSFLWHHLLSTFKQNRFGKYSETCFFNETIIPHFYTQTLHNKIYPEIQQKFSSRCSLKIFRHWNSKKFNQREYSRIAPGPIIQRSGC